MNGLKKFNDIVNDPAGYARSWKAANGGKVVGSFCSYAPEEIFLAAEVLGYRIFSTGEEISRADAHMQAYSCSLVRGALEESLAGRLEFIDGVVFPHTCDSIQRLSDIWRLNVKEGFHLDLILPVKLNSDSSREYMAEVIAKFKVDFEQQLGVEITEEKLKRAIVICNQVRETVQKLYQIRLKTPSKISGHDFHAVIKAGMVMDRLEFLEALQELIGELEKLPTEERSDKRLVISGGLCNMPDIYPVIEKTGALVVMDDLCTGSRFYEGMIDPEASNPLMAIAHRYSNRNVCPAKHSGIRSRGENLVKIAKEAQADGVLFIYLKFCDPHGFDYPYIKQMLEENDIPCLLYEMEELSATGGQFETRCEAFIEML